MRKSTKDNIETHNNQLTDFQNKVLKFENDTKYKNCKNPPTTPAPPPPYSYLPFCLHNPGDVNEIWEGRRTGNNEFWLESFCKWESDDKDNIKVCKYEKGKDNRVWGDWNTNCLNDDGTPKDDKRCNFKITCSEGDTRDFTKRRL